MLGSAIANIPHLAAFETMAARAFAAIDKTALLMYIVDAAPADALNDLAAQLNILGFKGWYFAETEAQKRDAIRRAITLHKKKGTPYAIREALMMANPDIIRVEIIKLEGGAYDGSFDYDGAEDYGGGFWANFLVRIYVPDGYTLSPADELLVREIIAEYKNERSNLVAVEFWEDAIIGGVVYDATYYQTAINQDWF